MLGTYVLDHMVRFRRNPNDMGLAKAVVDELNVLIERVTQVKQTTRQALSSECKMLEVIRCIKNQRLHNHKNAGKPLFSDADQTGFYDERGNLVCKTLFGDVYSLIDIAEGSSKYLKSYLQLQD